MNSTYKGDSPNKKVSRALAWIFGFDVMKKALGEDPLGALVLAGGGGDLSTLRGVARVNGINPEEFLSNCTAADLDTVLVDNAVGKYGCKGIKGDISARCTEALPYNMSHMDWCGPISVTTLHATAEAIKNSSGVFSFHLITILRGHEQGPRKNCSIALKAPRSARRRLLKAIKADESKRSLTSAKTGLSVLTRGYVDFSKELKLAEATLRSYCDLLTSSGKTGQALNYVDKRGNLTKYANGVIRGAMFADCLQVMLYNKFILGTVFTDVYQSITEEGKGSPLVTLGLVAARVPDHISNKKVLSESDYAEIGQAFGWMQGVVDRCAKHPLSGELSSLYHGKQSHDSNRLREYCVKFAVGVGSNITADLFNMAPGTVAGWLAHARMGTYGKQASAFVKHADQLKSSGDKDLKISFTTDDILGNSETRWDLPSPSV